MTEKDFYKHKKANISKLTDFGFKKIKNIYKKDFRIFDNQFLLTVEIEPPNKYKTKMKEIETNEIYTLHLTDSEGTFVGKIRDEYEHILNGIAQNCFDTNVFKSDLFLFITGVSLLVIISLNIERSASP